MCWAAHGGPSPKGQSTSRWWIQGVGTARAALAVRSHGHTFVGPDNGIFSYVLTAGPFEAVTLETPERAAPTFHGRDLFAPAAARILMGYPLHLLGAPASADLVRLTAGAPHYEGKVVVGEVIYVDRFGTLVTNLTTEEVPDYAVLETNDLEVGRLQKTFGDVREWRAGELRRLGRAGGDRRARWIGGPSAGYWRGS